MLAVRSKTPELQAAFLARAARSAGEAFGCEAGDDTTSQASRPWAHWFGWLASGLAALLALNWAASSSSN